MIAQAPLAQDGSGKRNPADDRAFRSPITTADMLSRLNTLDDLPSIESTQDELPLDGLLDEVPLRQRSAPLLSRSSGWGISGFYDFGYELRGSGDMGTVRRAARRGDGIEVAVRCLCSRDEDERQAARKEFELLCALSHDAIIRVEALYVSPFDVWLCMECCPEGSVQAAVEANGPLGERQALTLLRQLLRGVDFLHRRRLAHCNLVPEHLLLHRQGTSVKIVDFRSAKRSSKRAAGAPRDPHEQGDLWASGLCGFYMLRGGPPEGLKLDTSVLTRCIEEKTLPALNWGNVEVASRALVLKCLEVRDEQSPLETEALGEAALGEGATSPKSQRSASKRDSGLFRSL